MPEVEDRTLVEQPTLVVREKLPVADIPAFLGRAYGMIGAVMGRAGGKMAGMPFARYTRLGEAEFEVEAGFPLVAPVDGSGEVEAATLPSGPAAAVWHIGPYETLEVTYGAVEAWLAERSLEPDGPPWEAYYSDPHDQPDPATWRTEIVQPYKKG